MSKKSTPKATSKVASKAATKSTQKFLLGLIRPYRWQLLGGSLLLVVSAAAMLSLPQYLRHMFDTAIKSQDPSQLAISAGYMFATVLVMVVGTQIRARLIGVTAIRIIVKLRQDLASHLLNQDTVYFESTTSGAIASRVMNDAVVLMEFTRGALPMFVRGLFLGIGVIIALVYTSPYLTGLLMLALVPLGFAGWLMGKKLRSVSRQQQDNVAAFNDVLMEMLNNISTIAAFSQQTAFRAVFDTRVNTMRKNGEKRVLLNAALMSTNVLIGFMALIGVVWLGGMQVMQGQLSLGEMMAFLLYLAFAADAAGNLAQFWPAWQETLGSSERLVAMLQQSPSIASSKSPVALQSAKNGREINISRLSYTYPARPESPAISNLTLTIPAGQNVAIVGPSGAGKSTLFRMLLRLDDPTSGTIKLDGTDLKNLDLSTLRSQFALVAQDSPLFTGTVAHNVTFSDASATENQIWAALKAANAESFVRKLPKQLQTPVGEKGVQLSGGQKQRLAIARAILADAPILLLDEATAHLDSESEAEIQKSLQTLTKNKTTLTIAHRLSTVKSADLILVFNQGQLEAQGTHAQLLKSSELYRALATLQLQA